MASANFKSCDFFFLDKGCNLDALAFADCACNSVAAESLRPGGEPLHLF